MNLDTKTINENSFPRWGILGTLLWTIFIGISFVFIQVSAMAIYIGFTYGEQAVNDSAQFDRLMAELQFNGTVLSISTISTAVLCSLLVLLAIKLKKGSNFKDYIGLKKVDFKTAFSWWVVIVVFIICSDILTTSLGRPIVPEFMTAVYTSVDEVWILWLALIVAAPLFEELFFRGFIYSGLSVSVTGPIGAIFITSLVWAIIHGQYDLYEISIIFFMGIILGTARWKTGSLLLPIGLHAFCNLVATIETMIHVS